MIKERLDKYTDKSGDCWEWVGAKFRKGYGRLTVDGKSRSAHRLSYEQHYGVSLTKDVLVCHTCDNPGCVNPAHLFVGSHSDNHADRNAKGRQARGVNNGGGGKLTRAQALAIKHLRGIVSGVKLAERFGVSQQLISRIQLGGVWAW